MAVPKDQGQRRRAYNALDEFGRKWLVNVEIATGDLCGAAIACFDEGKDAIPPKYLDLDPANPRAIRIDWALWLADADEGARSWDEQKDVVGQQLYSENYDETKAPTQRMLRLLGPRPAGAERPRMLKVRLAKEAKGLRPSAESAGTPAGESDEGEGFVVGAGASTGRGARTARRG